MAEIGWTRIVFALLATILVGMASAQSSNMRIVYEESSLYAVTGRAGALGFLGHNHAITAEEWSATLCYRPDAVQESSIEVVVSAQALRIDTPRGVELAGLESSPSEETIADLQERMLSSEFLAAQEFPELRFVSARVSRRDASTLAVEGDLTIHGRTNPVSIQVDVERADDGTFMLSTHFTFLMSDFGITPENTLGIISVADEMDAYVDLVARRTTRTCT